MRGLVRHTKSRYRKGKPAATKNCRCNGNTLSFLQNKDPIPCHGRRKMTKAALSSRSCDGHSTSRIPRKRHDTTTALPLGPAATATIHTGPRLSSRIGAALIRRRTWCAGGCRAPPKTPPSCRCCRLPGVGTAPCRGTQPGARSTRGLPPTPTACSGSTGSTACGGADSRQRSQHDRQTVETVHCGSTAGPACPWLPNMDQLCMPSRDPTASNYVL
jgi:hypothetical protein